MGIRNYKPTSPGRRGASGADFVEVTKSTPEKSLLGPTPKSGGRNVHGRITSRHRGGGHKQRYRIIDFRRNKDGVPAKVAAIEYDPNRTSRIALLHYLDGEKRYILAPNRLAVAQHPGRHLGPRRGAAPWRRRQDGPLGRGRHPAAGQGGWPRHPADALGRDPPGRGDLPGHGRRGRQLRA